LIHQNTDSTTREINKQIIYYSIYENGQFPWTPPTIWNR